MISITEGLPVVVFAHGLSLVRELSSRRVRTPIVLITDNPRAARQACLLWGVVPTMCTSFGEENPRALSPLTSLSSSTTRVLDPAPPASSCPDKVSPIPSFFPIKSERVWQALLVAGVEASVAVVVDDTTSPVHAMFLRRDSKL
jgi:hypothetical protein